MQYTIQRQTLRDAVNFAHNGRPEGVHGGAVRLQFNNGSRFDYLLPGGTLGDWLGALDAGELDLRLAGGSVELTAGGSSLRLLSLSKLDKARRVGDRVGRHHFGPVALDAPAGGGEFLLATGQTKARVKWLAKRAMEAGTPENQIAEAHADVAEALAELKDGATGYHLARVVAGKLNVRHEITERKRQRDGRRFVRAVHRLAGKLTGDALLAAVADWLPLDVASEYRDALADAVAAKERADKWVGRGLSNARTTAQNKERNAPHCILSAARERFGTGWQAVFQDRDEERRLRSYRLTMRKWRNVIQPSAAAKLSKARKTLATVEERKTLSGMAIGEAAEAVRLLAPFCSKDETRYVIQHVHIMPKDGIAVGTDGRRLAWLRGDYSATVNAESEDGSGSYAQDGNYNPEAGVFPNWRQVVPQGCACKVAVDPKWLAECVKQAAKLTSDKAGSIRVHLQRDLITFTANQPDIGESKVAMPVCYRDKELMVGVNPKFLLDTATLAKRLGFEEIALEFTDELSPIYAKGGDKFGAVMMPMRLA
jgi:hypothetical protein